MSGGPKGAKRPLERPLDGGVRFLPHAHGLLWLADGNPSAGSLTGDDDEYERTPAMTAAMIAVIALTTIAAIAMVFCVLATLSCSTAIDAAEAELVRLRSSSLSLSQASTSNVRGDGAFPKFPSASARRTPASPRDSRCASSAASTMKEMEAGCRPKGPCARPLPCGATLRTELHGVGALILSHDGKERELSEAFGVVR